MRRLLTSLALLLIGLDASPLRAELAEEFIQYATDGDAGHLFPLNPAVLKPKGAQAGVLFVRQSRTSVLDHKNQGGDRIESEASDDIAVAGALVDLGAGAGLGLSHQAQFHKVATSLDGQPAQNDKNEVTKTTHTAAKLIVELTDELRAAVSIRFLHKEATIFGDPSLGANMATRYHTSLIGYGAGFTYTFQKAGLGYTYFPPLHGKTEVYGEERIVAEPGQIAVDGYFKLQGPWTIGLLGKRWLNEIDDLASGTTASDDQTKISLYGLDPDQYLIRDQLILIGADYAFSKQTAVRFSIGQEQDHLNFQDLFQYQGVGVRARGMDRVKTNRARVALRFVNNGMELDTGLGALTRSYDFPDAEQGGSYQVKDGRELFAAIGLKI